MFLATKTMAAIAAGLEKDQGAKFRGLLKDLMPLAGDAYSTREDKFRAHLGASLIGRECSREVWYGWHWTTVPQFEHRIIRLFNRGHLEEPRFVALLQMIGCQIWQLDQNGKQFRISGYKGHFGGSMDGVGLGIPDMPDEPLITEFKTHNDKSFAKLVKEGVEKAKWEHYVQMQIYMGKNALRFALYMAVNKNDDAIHAEIVAFDQNTYDRYISRSEQIIDSMEAPMKINMSPSWFQCKFCDHSPVCHGKALPDRNCRTCAHSTPIDGGKWICEQDSLPTYLSEADQLAGCSKYIMNPTMKS